MVIAHYPSFSASMYNHLFIGLYPYVYFRDDELFSLTETPDELSLIVEESYLAHFPRNSLEIEPHVWRVIQLDVGAMGYCKQL